jgi:hypothetical protein
MRIVLFPRPAWTAPQLDFRQPQGQVLDVLLKLGQAFEHVVVLQIAHVVEKPLLLESSH